MVDNLKRNTDFDAVRQEAEADIRNDSAFNESIEPSLEELKDLEQEVGLQEVYLDEAALDNIPADTSDDNYDVDDDGVDDDLDAEEQISDLPQEVTQSYGTGLQGQPSDRAGRYSRRSDNQFYNNPDATLTGGDIDANYEQASVVGDEAVGGTVATPDQDIVDELGAAVGLEMDDRSFLRTGDILEERDDRRWELDPKSSEDYSDRRDS
jgi:hypothetical protein